MPLIDSFQVDHTIMPSPSVRLAKSLRTPRGDTIEVYDLRFYAPNRQMMTERGTHTLEHFFAGFMREYINSPAVEVIDISPMGCRTGFYMSLIGTADPARVAAAMTSALEDIAALPDDAEVPAANVYQCGSCRMHSLPEARQTARDVLDHGPIAVVRSQDIALSQERLGQLYHG